MRSLFSSISVLRGKKRKFSYVFFAHSSRLSFIVLFSKFTPEQKEEIVCFLDFHHSFHSRLSNSDDPIAQRLDERLRNNSYPNIGTTCMKDAPPASDKASYVCGKGDPEFYYPPDYTDYNQRAQCSECYTKTLQVSRR